MKEITEQIKNGKIVLGIELGSTRIKGVLLCNNEMIASGGYEWASKNLDGIWTYDLEEAWKGVQEVYLIIKKEILENFGITIKKLEAIGFSGMMHGYLPFDKNDQLLTPFRTWRNTFTQKASKELTETFDFVIPQRWSIAHLYQAILNKEEHVKDIVFITTLAGYIHWQLTGEKNVSISEGSGMFPVDNDKHCYDKKMISEFHKLIEKKNYNLNLNKILPTVKLAGENAGVLTEKGAKLLDPAGDLIPGSLFCPPEGDAGTGMVATNSVNVNTGNVSAGTSTFALVVLEKALKKRYEEIETLASPDGKPVAMVHTNNCTVEYGDWIKLFGEVCKTLGFEISQDKLFDQLIKTADNGDPDCGPLLAYGYHAGEHITHFEEGRPLFTRISGEGFNLPNFIRAQLYTCLCALKTGMNILIEDEKAPISNINGHGGFFKTQGTTQRIMAAALNVPVSVYESASEGGAWGIAILASYMINKQNETLSQFLENLFSNSVVSIVDPDSKNVEGFNKFFKRYHQGLPIERAAVDFLK